MATKDTRLPQIRVTSFEKEKIYNMAKESGLNFSEFALSKLLNDSDVDCESKLYKLIYKYEKKKRESNNSLDKHNYTLKINSILDIIYDLKEV